MTIISFMYFKDKIKRGVKDQTLRRDTAYWRQLEPGALVYLWWKNRGPDREFIGKARITETLPNVYLEDFTEKLAIRDGFRNLWEMTEAFRHMYPKEYATMAYIIIRWIPEWIPEPEGPGLYVRGKKFRIPPSQRALDRWLQK